VLIGPPEGDNGRTLERRVALYNCSQGAFIEMQHALPFGSIPERDKGVGNHSPRSTPAND